MKIKGVMLSLIYENKGVIRSLVYENKKVMLYLVQKISKLCFHQRPIAENINFQLKLLVCKKQQWYNPLGNDANQ